MDRLLARLERTILGKLAIEQLTRVLVFGTALVFVVGLVRHDLVGYLTLQPGLLLQQPWRIVTFLFIPSTDSVIWILFSLSYTYMIGTNLESEWGAFKFNAYYLIGAAGTLTAALVTGVPQGNLYLNLSLVFAFATLFPDYEILLFVFPIRVKWVALVSAVLAAFAFVDGGIGAKAAIGASLANYFLFFSGHLAALVRGRRLAVRQAARRSRQSPVAAREEGRACAICGARQDDGADIRVCSCAKCGGPRNLCLAHARDH